jgi:two-component sensor histidine kinase
MTGLEDEELAVKTVQKGAQDYLVKGQVDSKLLSRALRYAVERKRAEKQIKASLREKEVLLQEVHHRVKNNMQIISSLLRLQSRKIKGKRALQAFESSYNRVKSMVLIHERLYQSRDFARVDFAEYVHGLTNHLFSLFHIGPETVKLDINIKDISLDLNTAIPCGLIVNELVSNSLKHAFPDDRKGKVKIVMKSLNTNEIELTASDNGIGIPEDLDFRETESLGLHLVSILAEDQLRGKIKLDKTKGTRFEIKFKAKQ